MRRPHVPYHSYLRAWTGKLQDTNYSLQQINYEKVKLPQSTTHYIIKFAIVSHISQSGEKTNLPSIVLLAYIISLDSSSTTSVGVTMMLCFMELEIKTVIPSHAMFTDFNIRAQLYTNHLPVLKSWKSSLEITVCFWNKAINVLD